MIDIRRAKEFDLPRFSEMERAGDSAAFVIPYPLDKHQKEFEEPYIIYLSVYSRDELVGFMILALDSDGASVEFRRIVIAKKGEGIGQSAIEGMERYCRDKLHRRRIWLDVFDTNGRARHVYQKLGYKQFSQDEYEGRKLLLYEKHL